jgi:succinate dehydrogenase / fumarate reductase cytochrome b subunit
MQNIKGYLSSTIGKKQIVAVTGLIWAGFVLTHMAGNMLILVGADAYNKYSYTLISNPFLIIAELILAVSFLIHVGLAIQLSIQDKAARPIKPYQLPSNCEKRASFASRTMIYTGLVTLVFVIWHLKTFKWGSEYTTTVHGVEMRDLHKLVLEKFSDPLYFGLYIAALIVLGLHLSHGASSLVQSLGFGSVRNKKLKRAGWAFAAIVALGFISQPLYVFLGRGH